VSELTFLVSCAYTERKNRLALTETFECVLCARVLSSRAFLALHKPEMIFEEEKQVLKLTLLKSKLKWYITYEFFPF
jgi:hypothetical protein